MHWTHRKQNILCLLSKHSWYTPQHYCAALNLTESHLFGAKQTPKACCSTEHTPNTWDLAPKHITKPHQSRPKFSRHTSAYLGAKPKLFGQLRHHFHLFDAEEIPFSAISHLFGTKLYHPSWQKIGRSFFGFFGMLRHARRQAKVFFAYFGVTWCQATLFDLFQYCLHLYSTLAWWISM